MTSSVVALSIEKESHEYYQQTFASSIALSMVVLHMNTEFAQWCFSPLTNILYINGLTPFSIVGLAKLWRLNRFSRNFHDIPNGTRNKKFLDYPTPDVTFLVFFKVITQSFVIPGCFFIDPSIFIFILRFCPCRILWRRQQQAMSNTGSHASLFCWSAQVRPHLLTPVFTHSYHVFLCFPWFLVSASRKFVTASTRDVPGCTNLRSSGAEGVSSLYLMPQIQGIMARPSRQSRCSSGLFGLHISRLWSKTEQTQA